MAMSSSVALIVVLMACAAAHALAQASVQFVPSGCTLQNPIMVTARRGWNPWIVCGTVTLKNGNQFAVPIQSVQVAVQNTIPVAPIYITASCLQSSVPFNPAPYQYGTLTCTYTVRLPFGFSSWPASNPAAWNTVTATATIAMSGAQCNSAVTPITGDTWGLSSSSTKASLAVATTRLGGMGASSSGDASSSTGPVTAMLGGSSNGSGNRKLLQSVQFVPQGCSGLQVAASAQFSGSSIQGSVTLSNPNSFNIPITGVKVTLVNNIPVAPMYTNANCGGATSVPFSPIPYQMGQLTCYFSTALPTNGPAASPSVWTDVTATATIGMSGATCDSPVAPIQQLLMGRK